MNKLQRFLRTPYSPLYQTWKAVVIPSLIIFLILYLLQPFGISQLPEGKFLLALGNALTTAAISGIFNYLLPLLFPRAYDERRWTIGKHLGSLLAMLLLITIGVWLEEAWIFGVRPDAYLLLLALCWVMTLAIFPTVFFLMWNHNLKLKHHLQEAVEMNRQLSESRQPAPTETGEEKAEARTPLHFTGTTKEALEIDAESFLYAEAEGNYVRIAYRKKPYAEVKKKLLRATMKQVEEATQECHFVLRCHRAFLVNIRQVTRVDGNSQGYRLLLDGCTEEVPVSRAYAKPLKEQIALLR